MFILKKVFLSMLVVFGLVVLCSTVEAKPNWKLPLESGHYYQVMVEYGGLTYEDDTDLWHTDVKNAYYAIDFDNPSDCSEPKIVATASGVISKIGYVADGYGNYVYIDHGEGYVSRYAHLKSIDAGIQVGVSVEQGQPLGIMGKTGNSTGTHLHFVILYNGKCLKSTLEAKPEPLSEYTDIKVKQKLYSDNYPQNLVPQNSTFIKFSGNPAVYYVFKDQIWPLRNETTFKNMGNSDFSKVIEYPASQYDQIVAKFPVKRVIVNEHLIAKLDCNPKVYRFTDGKWHCFSDWDVFTSWGYSDKDIVEIPQAVFNMYPEGTKLTTRAYALKISFAKGWNYWIGHAYTEKIAGNSDAVCIEYQSKKVSLAQAIDNGWIYKTAYGHNGDLFDFAIKDGEFKSAIPYFIYSFVSDAKICMYGILKPADLQAVNDMDKAAVRDSRFKFKELYSLKIVDDWSPSWDLRIMSYQLSPTSSAFFAHATSKSNSSIRYMMYQNPETKEWTSWQRVY